MKSVLPVLLCIPLLTGCVYMKDRALDFADIWSVKVGYGGPVSAGVSGFGVAYVSVGVSWEWRYGFLGRNHYRDKLFVVGVPVANIAAPIKGFSFLGDSWFGEYAVPLILLGPFATGGERVEVFKLKEVDEAYYKGSLGFNFSLVYDKFFYGMKEIFPRKRYYDLRVHGCAGVSFEFGFSPIEFADFLLGWTTLDIAGDDTKARKKKKQAEENAEPGEEEE